MIGSTLKGIVTGVLLGAVARKVRSLPIGLTVGAVAGLFFAWLIAVFPDESRNHYYVEIMTPGAILGLIVGFATQKFGRAPRDGAQSRESSAVTGSDPGDAAFGVPARRPPR